MRISNVAMTAAASMLTVTPVALHAAPVERAAARSVDDSELSGNSRWFLLAFVVFAIVLFALTDEDSVSP